MAAARVIQERRPDGVTAALLAYLPAAGDETAEDALLRALLGVGVKDGQPDAAPVKVLADKDALRRVAAAYVLGRAVPGQRDAVRRLFADAEPRRCASRRRCPGPRRRRKKASPRHRAAGRRADGARLAGAGGPLPHRR